LVLSAIGCNYDFPGKPNRDDRPVPDDQMLQFGWLYSRNCAGCHGADGKLGPAPPLNDATFLAIVPEEKLLRVIREGRHGTPMPGFAQSSGGSLTSAQVSALAEGIKLHWKSAKQPVDAAPAYLLTKADDASISSGSRAAGAEIFARACAQCHGELTAKGEQPGAGVGTIVDPDFLALISDQALRRIIITGRPDLGMPAYSAKDGRPADFQPLTSSEIDDLVALLAARRAGEDGDTTSDSPKLHEP
jgi:mono/diheme cytochrome c family protein